MATHKPGKTTTLGWEKHVHCAQACIAAGGLDQQDSAAGERLTKLMASTKKFVHAKVCQKFA